MNNEKKEVTPPKPIDTVEEVEAAQEEDKRFCGATMTSSCTLQHGHSGLHKCAGIPGWADVHPKPEAVPALEQGGSKGTLYFYCSDAEAGVKAMCTIQCKGCADRQREKLLGNNYCYPPIAAPAEAIQEGYIDKSHRQDCQLRYITAEEAKDRDYGCTCPKPESPQAEGAKVKVDQRIYAHPIYLEGLFRRIESAFGDNSFKGIKRLFEAEIEEMEKREPKESQPSPLAGSDGEICHMCGDGADHEMGGMPTCINCDSFMGMLTFPTVPREMYPWIARVQAHSAKLTNAAKQQSQPVAGSYDDCSMSDAQAAEQYAIAYVCEVGVSRETMIDAISTLRAQVLSYEAKQSQPVIEPQARDIPDEAVLIQWAHDLDLDDLVGETVRDDIGINVPTIRYKALILKAMKWYAQQFRKAQKELGK